MMIMTLPEGYIEARVYEASAGDRVRIAIRYKDSWRFIFWFSVGRDGSIYLGPRYTEINSMKVGATQAKEGRLTVKYEEGQQVTDPDSLKLKGKVSFHASGIIHAAGSRLAQKPLRDIVEQKELCRVLFQHPSRFGSDSVGDRDVCLDYPFDEERPMQAILCVAPRDKVRLIRIRDCDFQINLVFTFGNLDGMGDIVVELILFHGSKVKEPPYTYLIFGPLETPLLSPHQDQRPSRTSCQA